MKNFFNKRFLFEISRLLQNQLGLRWRIAQNLCSIFVDDMVALECSKYKIEITSQSHFRKNYLFFTYVIYTRKFDLMPYGQPLSYEHEIF